MKKIIIITTLLLTAKSFSQNSDLLRLWYLTKVTIDDTDYIPSDYGYYPDLDIKEINNYYFITLADPMNIFCETFIENFQTNPDSFTVDQNSWAFINFQTCMDNPDGPCSTIYGKHSEIYYDIFLPFNYIINQNGDEFTLEITNSEGNHAYYSSIPLSQPEFSKSLLTLYPNPVTDILHISSTDIISKVSVYDIQGKVIKTISEINSNTSKTDLSRLQNGVYFISVVSENGEKLTKKVVKKG